MHRLIFNYISLTPAVGAQNLNAASGAVTNLARGLRVVFVGGAVATVAVITATAGVSDVICEAPHVVGIKGGNGTIGYENTGAAVTSGTMQATVCYTPMDEGSNMSANF